MKKKLCIIVVCFMLLILSSSGVYAGKRGRLYKDDADQYRNMMMSYTKDYNFDEARFAIHDFNGDGRKDIIITNVTQGAGGYDTPRVSYILMRVGKKYQRKRINGTINTAGNQSFLISTSYSTYTKEWAEGKGRGCFSQDTIFQVSRSGKVKKKASCTVTQNYMNAPKTIKYKDGKGKSISNSTFKAIHKNSRLKKLKFKSMFTDNISRLGK